MGETWMKVGCPNCRTQNWVCLGDMLDQTVPDIDAIECWKCDYQWMTDPELSSDLGEEEPMMMERGRRNPDDPTMSPKKEWVKIDGNTST